MPRRQRVSVSGTPPLLGQVTLQLFPIRRGEITWARIQDQQLRNVSVGIAAVAIRQPDAELLLAELRAAVDAAIAELTEAQRLAVVLRRYEQMPYEEIASVLSLSVSAVKSLLFRARSTLRESLSSYLAE